MDLTSENFGFLSFHSAQLAQLGALAEDYFRHDPATAIFKLRQFAELLAKQIAARHALYQEERQSFEETLRLLRYERVIPREVGDVFHTLRKIGNEAAHEIKGTHSEALKALKLARELGVWFHRTYGKQPNFKPGPFVPPRKPADVAARFKQQLDELQRQLTETAEAAARVVPQFEISCGSRFL